jgi:hypothetical protein
MKNCSSCNTPLIENSDYCHSCGGKIVTERLSLKGIWKEFVGPFFSWDNNFRKTCHHLITQPEKVCQAYIEGAREKYFKPFPFLIVYSTISLFFLKLSPYNFQKSFQMGYESQNRDINPEKAQAAEEFMQGFSEVFYGYYNFILVLLIPFMATISYLVFKKYKNNMAEHFIFQSYAQALTGYLGILTQIIAISILGFSYESVGSFSIILSFIYINYLFIRMYRLSFGKILIANLKAIILNGLMFVFSILLGGAIYGLYLYLQNL